MTPTEYQYEAGGKTYIQRPAIFAQMLQLLKHFKGFTIPEGNLTPEVLIPLLEGNFPLAATIVLRDQDGNIPWLASRMQDGFPVAFIDEDKFLAHFHHIAQHFKADDYSKGLQDFFACTLSDSYQEEAGKLAGMLIGTIRGMQRHDTSSASSELSPSSPEEISPSATASSGDIPSESASPI